MSQKTWEDAPEPVLLKIFAYLPVKDVLAFGTVCQRWHEISSDNLLWKSLLRRDFRSKMATIRPGSTSWKEEYIRLVVGIPTVKVQTLVYHQDEVLHVGFSHDGSEIVSCSKDHTIVVWKREGIHFSPHFMQDMESYSWIHTWAAQYNENDTRLMVAGVIDAISGEIAIFNTGRDGTSKGYFLMCRVVNDPYDVLGCWCSEQFFLCGTSSHGSAGSINARIFLCTPVIAEESGISTDCYKKLLFKYINLQGTICVRYLQVHKRKKFDEKAVNWRIGENVFSRYDRDAEDLTEAEEADILKDDCCMIFLCGDRTKIPHQIGFQRISADYLRNTKCLKGPEALVDFNGHVIGVAISPDGRYLYVNVRTWPDNALPSADEPPPISNHIELQVVDLETLTIIGHPLLGHQGYTPSEQAFYLYVDVSENLVASGSEDKKGCLWDRHYGALVGRLLHNECVNCVVFCPNDEEICVSASDDKTLSVWTSPRRMKELEALHLSSI